MARTTLRNIIGTLTLESASSERGKINSELQRTMREETNHWGIEIVRTELKEIDPPKDVQATMNKVVKAENEKAEGIKQAKILEAEGEAQAIQLVNQAADKFFIGNAQLLRRLIAMETALARNSKIVVPMNTELMNIIGDMAGILPLGPSRSAGPEKPNRLAPVVPTDLPPHSVKGNGGG